MKPKGWLFIALIGVAFWYIGHQGVVEYQTMSGQLARTLSESARAEYQTAKLMQNGGAFVAFIAGGIALYKWNPFED